MIETSYRILDIAEKTKSLSKAAEMLHMTPSAASRAVSKLESEMGVKLLSRNTGGVQLTEAGRVVLPFVRMALSAEYRMGEELGRLCDDDRGTVRVGVFSSVGCVWMPEIIRTMREAHPEIELIIREGGYADLRELLEMSELDVIFTSLSGPMPGDLQMTPLVRDRLLCITPRDFIPRSGDVVTIEELSSQTFVLPCEGNDFDAKMFMEDNRLDISNPHYVSDDLLIISLVASGLGISIMPELVMEKVGAPADDIHVYPIESAPFREIGIATQKREYVTKATRTFIKTVRQYIDDRYPVELPYFR